jgi:PAT family beta-lactamase induction signal transducer AmpG
MVGMISSIVGGIVGGLYMARLGLFRALIIFGVIQNLGNFAFMWLAHIGHNYPGMVFAIFCENFTGGLGNTAFVAAIMALCNKQFSASQFAVLTALTSVGRVYVGYPAALMVEHLGWMWFYFGTVLIGIPGIIAVLFCRRHIPQH